MTLTWASAGSRASLFTSVESLLSNAKRYGRVCAVYVATNGPNEAVEKELIPELGKVTRRFGTPGFISSLAIRERAFPALSQEFDPQVLQTALIPQPELAGMTGPGANQNTTLLAHAGRTLLSSDDDVIARPARLNVDTDATNPDDHGKPTWSKAYLPAQIRFCRTRDEVIAAVESTEIDILGAHATLLGNTIKTPAPDGAENSGLVRITTAGAYGGSGIGAARTVLVLDGATRSSNFSDDASYDSIRYSSELVRIPDRRYVGPGTHLMGMHIGLDNSRLLPPMAPFGRNADGLFGITTRIIDRESVTGFLDFGLFHDTASSQPFSRDRLIQIGVGVHDLVMPLVVAARPDSGIADPTDRLRHLGAVLVEIAALPTSEFFTVVHQAWSRNFYAYAERLENLLEKYDRQPPLWSSDVEEHLEVVYERLREPTSIFPTRRGVGSVERSKQLIGMYGRLLEIWPDLWEFFAERIRTGAEPLLYRPL